MQCDIFQVLIPSKFQRSLKKILIFHLCYFSHTFYAQINIQDYQYNVDILRYFDPR